MHPPNASVAYSLPVGVTVFERGWLSSNNILIQGAQHCALIDSGYHTHAPQTLALLASVLQGRALDLLVNTHLHSDHCGGNAALQGAYPAMQTRIPPGHAEQVRQWDPYALSYTPSGQHCPQFCFDSVLQPGTTVALGDALWQVHAAPGHDPHSLVLFEPESRTLVSADALWERGFGVVFPALDGAQAFDEVAATLDLIEALQPATVIPGHGAPFAAVGDAIAFARQRLSSFVANPLKHHRYAAKALFKFKLLEEQRIDRTALIQWAQAAPLFTALFDTHFADHTVEQMVDWLVADLVRSGAATVQGTVVHNA